MHLERKKKKALVLSLLTVFLLTGCTRETSLQIPVLEEPASFSYDLAVAYRGDLSELALYDAWAVPEVENAVFTKGGHLSGFHADIGDEVKQGEIIAYLDGEETEEEEALKSQKNSLQKNYEYNRQQLEYKLQIADLEYGQIKADYEKLTGREKKEKNIELVKKENEKSTLNLQLKQEKEQWDLDLAQMEQRLSEYETKIAENTLTAPCSGTVVYIDYPSAGKNIEAGQTVAAIAKESELYLQTEYIADTLLDGAAEIYAVIGKDRVEIQNIPYSDSEYTALKLSEGTLRSRFRLADSTYQKKLQPGTYAGIFLKHKEKENVLLIPADALTANASGTYVYVLQNGERVKRTIVTGVRTSGQVEVVSGINEGEIVSFQTRDQLDRDKEEGTITEEVKNGEYTESYSTSGLEYSILSNNAVAMDGEQAIFSKYRVKAGDTVAKGDIIMEYRTPYDEIDIEESRLLYKRTADEYKEEQKERKERLNQLKEEVSARSPQSVEGKTGRLNYLMEESSYLKYCSDREAYLKELADKVKEQEAKAAIQYLYSPYDGTVQFMQPLEEGDSIAKGAGIMLVTRPESAVLIIQNISGILKYGMEVRIEDKLSGVNGEKSLYTGRVTAAGNILKAPLSLDYAVIQLEGREESINTDASVLSADIVKVEDVPVIPSSLYIQKEKNGYVYTVQGALIVKIPVQGRVSGEEAWIYNGLDAGETVYGYGEQKE